MNTPEEYFTQDALEYLRDRFDDIETCVKFQEQGQGEFPRGEFAQMLTLQNVLRIALKIPRGDLELMPWREAK